MRKKLKISILSLLCLFITGCAGTENHNETNTAAPQISYDSAVVSYLGPEGTYTQEACGIFFNNQGSYISYETVGEAVEALKNGESSYVVIPQENTIGGAVTDYVDILIENSELSVVGEVDLPINQNLLVNPGTTLADIKTVYSHKQGIAQGKEWLETNLPNAEVIEVSSTAEGARKISEENDKSAAAIASAAAADVYNLEILASAIQNNENNKTRFYVLSLNEPVTSSSDRTAFIASGSADNLPSLMSKMDKQNMKLITIHDRPLKTELGEYAYLIECEGNYDSYSKAIKDTNFEFRYLGSFSVK